MESLHEKEMAKFDELVGGDTPVLVDFFATWCGPCKMMHPILEELKGNLGGKVRIVKIDIDNRNNIKIVQKFRVRSVPTLMIFRGGELLWHESGVKTAAQLTELLRQHGGVM